MRTAAERYEEIVKVIHRHRSALKEGDPSHYYYWAWIMRKVYQITRDDVGSLVRQDFLDAGEDVVKQKAMYAEWRKEIHAEMDEDIKRHNSQHPERATISVKEQLARADR